MFNSVSLFAWSMLGTVLAVCGIFLLQTAWLKKQRHWPLLCVAWSIIVGSLISWYYATSTDKSVALGLLVLTIVALLFLLILYYNRFVLGKHYYPNYTA